MAETKDDVDSVKPTTTTTTSPLLKTTISLILLQLISRLFSFSLNQLLLRSTTPQALGVATMGFEVVRDTSLFLLREGIRGTVIVCKLFVYFSTIVVFLVFILDFSRDDYMY